MPSFCSDNITIAAKTLAAHAKLFQIAFQKRDGSVMVTFPYYRDAHGLLCHAILKAGTQYPNQLDLTDSGQFTSHKVKYSHHPSGTAHFSQDGKIYSRIRRQSVPLVGAKGHLFTVQIQGLADFDALSPHAAQPAAMAKRTRINFEFPGESPEAIKFVAHWYSESELNALIAAGSVATQPTTGWIAMRWGAGAAVVGALIRNPYLQSAEQHYLLLFCEPIPLLDNREVSALIFLGGFDPPDVAFSENKDTGFLAFSYPTASYDRLIEKLGSVDFAPSSKGE